MASYSKKTIEQKKEEMNAILEQLEEGVKGVFTSENFINYLDTFSKFHNYSIGNIILIMMQCPSASHVASFNDWNKKFHRVVKKGEKGIRILVPTPKKLTKEREVTNPDGTVTTEEVEYKKMYFKKGTVFDVLQTVGEELPSLVKNLTWNNEQLNSFLKKVIASAPVPMDYDYSLPEDGANGYFKLDTNEIFIKPTLADLHQVKTAFHELGHYYAHTMFEAQTKDFDRATHEVIAEAVAYSTLKLLSNEFSVPMLDSSEYSFNYLAGWGDRDLKELKQTLSLISSISNEIFNWVSPLFEEDV